LVAEDIPYLSAKAVAIVTIQLQLFTSDSMDTMTTTCALLAIGMTFELLTILHSGCYERFPHLWNYPQSFGFVLQGLWEAMMSDDLCLDMIFD
jgi:hypothetical protein